MYDDSVTSVKCGAGRSESFKTFSTFILFLFAMIADRRTDVIRQESP